MPKRKNCCLSLRAKHLVAAALHFALFCAIVIVAGADLVPALKYEVTGAVTTGRPPGNKTLRVLVREVDTRWILAAIEGVCWASHLVTAALLFSESEWFLMKLARGNQPMRWIEYSASSTLMLLVIALVSGVSELGALMGVSFLNACMIAFGDAHERLNPCLPDEEEETTVRRTIVDTDDWACSWRKRGNFCFFCRRGCELRRDRFKRTADVDWSAWAYGALAALGAWVVVWTYYGLTVSTGNPPWFVNVIWVTTFLTFMGFAVVSVLATLSPKQYVDYETAYVVLSWVSKTNLAVTLLAASAS